MKQKRLHQHNQHPGRTGFTKLEFLIVLIILIPLWSFVTGMLVPLQFIYYLVTGWIFYLYDNYSAFTWNSETLYMGVGAFALYGLLIHLVGRRWRRTDTDHPWTWNLTGKVLILSTFAFVASITIVSLTHLTIWAYGDDHAWVQHRNAQASRRRTEDGINLNQFGIAQHTFCTEHKEILTYSKMNELNISHHSWQTHLLPLMEQNVLYEQIELDKPWNAEENKPVFQTEVRTFLTPGDLPSTDPETGYALTSYAGNAHIFAAGKPMTFDEITAADGTSNTILTGDIIQNLPPWGKPGNWRDPALGINKSPHGFGSSWNGGAYFLMADGSVQWFANDIDPQILKALSTPNGGELVLSSD
ncbi:MAG: DUF1559 domain-containing protein [Planctomycetaceae bacterium]|nr:DUF1559 domain-containing protein [Planctomycetaceae bacterium]